jgi:tryptophan halogenase
MKKIVIIGGGTAGWLTALFAKKNYPNSTIKLIESSKIGILGAGEGSTPNLVSFLKSLDINENELIMRVKATKKIGINFENWTEENSKFSHPFNLDPNNFSQSINLDSNNQKINYSYHFNARLLADYLKEIGINRGIECVDSNVTDFILENNKIKKIQIEDDIQIDIDFIFDCSGLNRLVAKLYNLEWNSYSEHLKVNAAIPFFLEGKNTIEKFTHTNAIAMKYGWMWQIPLQDRWGCGYIFNKHLINQDEAKKEIEEYLGHEIKIIKQIDFEPGTYKQFWVENCLMVGLSTGFLEPMEATSIMTIIIQLNEFLFYKTDNDENMKIYNDLINSINLQNMLFIRHHYNCSRNDTIFWKNYKNLELPTELKNITKNNLLSISNRIDFYEYLNTIGIDSNNLTFEFVDYELVNHFNHKKNKKTLL